jgi:hypothetical protein
LRTCPGGQKDAQDKRHPTDAASVETETEVFCVSLSENSGKTERLVSQQPLITLIAALLPLTDQHVAAQKVPLVFVPFCEQLL